MDIQQLIKLTDEDFEKWAIDNYNTDNINTIVLTSFHRAFNKYFVKVLNDFDCVTASQYIFSKCNKQIGIITVKQIKKWDEKLQREREQRRLQREGK